MSSKLKKILHNYGLSTVSYFSLSGNSALGIDPKVETITIGEKNTIYVQNIRRQVKASIEALKPTDPEVQQLETKLNLILFHKIQEHLFALEAKKNKYLSDPEVRERIEDLTNQVLARTYVSRTMSEKIKPEDIQKAYEEYEKSFDKPKPGIEPGHILVKDEATAKEVLTALNAGSDFSDLAKKYSLTDSKDNGGRKDIMPLDEIPPAISELKELEPGQYVKTPFQSQMGFHIVKVLRKLDITPLPMEKVEKILERNLFQIELKKLTKQLLHTTKIEYRDAEGKEVKEEKDLTPWLENPFVDPNENINKKEDSSKKTFSENLEEQNIFPINIFPIKTL